MDAVGWRMQNGWVLVETFPPRDKTEGGLFLPSADDKGVVARGRVVEPSAGFLRGDRVAYSVYDTLIVDVTKRLVAVKATSIIAKEVA